MSTGKMSALKPAKQPRLVNQSEVKRTESLTPAEFASHITAVEKSLPSTSHPTMEDASEMKEMTAASVKRPLHPKGHKVRNLSDVWGGMDDHNFLYVTDTLLLCDVWVQPVSVDTTGNAAYANVTFKEIVCAPHIKSRLATTKMAVDDLMKMLYLNDTLQWSMQGVDKLTYEEWINEKSASCVKVKGLEEGSNRAKLCNFIITEDREFSFYPSFLKGVFGMFFRKTCYHSYKLDSDDTTTTKFENPSMLKCSSTRGKFEYIIEARLIPLPDNWVY